MYIFTAEIVLNLRVYYQLYKIVLGHYGAANFKCEGCWFDSSFFKDKAQLSTAINMIYRKFYGSEDRVF